MPRLPIRWLHLSDFHVGKDNYAQRRMFKYILDYIRHKTDVGETPDIVFITGDIAYSGLESQYDEFNGEFYLPLVDDVLGKHWPGRIYTIPGNHDVNRTLREAAQRYGVVSKIPTFFDPTAQGLSKREVLFPRFEAFANNDYSHVEAKTWLFSNEARFTQTLDLHGHRVGILGVNTAWLSEGDRDKGEMTPGKAIIETGLDALRDCEVRIVLGHHPIDWFVEREAKAIRAALGKSNAVYLHGHLHLNESRGEEGAGFDFRTIQAGASFQSRDDEIWVNRILWAELDLDTKRIKVEPRQWDPDDKDWRIDPKAFPERFREPGRDYWNLPLPGAPTGTGPGVKGTAPAKLSLPPGWKSIDARFLKTQQTELSEEQALSYFDGRIPTWREALSPHIPRRAIVHKIVGDLNQVGEEGGIEVTVLVGAGGEGKSTALRQVVCDLVGSSSAWNVLWHDDSLTPLPTNFCTQLSASGGRWLIVSDDADLITKDVFDAVSALQRAGRRDIHFLLSCRDTDWIAAGGLQYRWSQYALYRTERLRGLSPDDARLIVNAWGAYGERGLGRLAGLQSDESAHRLIEEARLEQASSEGAFLGAMLRVRFGQDLRSHILNLLLRLESRPAPGGTLSHAFTYIAALHAENQLILTKEVLARALGCDLSSIKPRVTDPLGEEAAATRTGRYILTRHRAIAEAAVQILSETFHVDFDEIYVDLVRSAREVFLDHGSVPDVAVWNYLSNHFFTTSRQELGIRLARTLVEVEPNNAYFVVQLARLFREDGQAEQSVRVCREYAKTVKIDRAYYYEWGTSEGNVENHGLSVWLAGVSLADTISLERVNNKRARASLAGLAIAFGRLFDKYNDLVFIRACGAAATLGLRLDLDDKTRAILNNGRNKYQHSDTTPITPDLALDWLERGVIAAWEQREELEFDEWVQRGDELSYRDLARLLGIARESGRR